MLSETQFVFCETCSQETVELGTPRCAQCAQPGHFVREKCERCSAQRPAFDEVFALFEHEGAVAKAIHRLKYLDRSDLARPLGLLLAKGFQFAPEFRKLDVLVPVAVHEERFRARRYDHAALLTTSISRILGVPGDVSGLLRVKKTEQQVGLDETQRLANVEGAFSTSASFHERRVGLVDDVMTTGATVAEAAKTLKKAGAQSVTVLCLARQPRAS
jgi:ComF family protein